MVNSSVKTIPKLNRNIFERLKDQAELNISSEGKAIWVSPDDGEILNSDKITGSSYLPPLVVNNTVYILNDNGDLSAYN